MLVQNLAVAIPSTEPGTEPAVKVWPTFDHDISLTESREMINRYRRAHPGEIHAAAFTKLAFERLLAQDGCVGIRFYFGADASGMPALIGVGVDAEGNDLDEGDLMDKGFPCPPWCPIGSALDI